MFVSSRVYSNSADVFIIGQYAYNEVELPGFKVCFSEDKC